MIVKLLMNRICYRIGMIFTWQYMNDILIINSLDDLMTV